jgi:putative phage-type endonuclease
MTKAATTALRQNTPAWVDARPDFIGSSDLPVLTGNTIYATSIFSLWAIKTRQADPDPIDADTQELFDLGHALEDDIAERYTIKTGREVRRAGLMRVRKDLPWASASLDRVSARKGERRIIEAKWVPHRHWSAEPERVPSGVQDQVQWQLWVTGYDVADVAVLDGSKVYVHEIGPNDSYQADLLYIARWFRELVETRTPPPIDHSEATMHALGRLHPRPVLDLLPETPEIAAVADDFRRARIEAKAADQRAGLLGNALRLLIGDHQGVEGDAFRISWLKNADSSRTDWKAVAANQRRLVELLEALGTGEDQQAAAERLIGNELATVGLQALVGGQATIGLSDLLDGIEQLHTTTTEGPRVLRARFRDEETGKWA